VRTRLLLPGDLVFGGADARWQTLLGSCVAFTFWHPRLRLGAMCHCLLPKRAQSATGPHRLAGRYLDESLVWVQGQMRHYGTAPRDYEAGLFGGSVVSTGAPSDVGLRNVEAARHLLSAGGWDGWREDVLGAGNRKLCFDLSSGSVSVSFHAPGQRSRDDGGRECNDAVAPPNAVSFRARGSSRPAGETPIRPRRDDR